MEHHPYQPPPGQAAWGAGPLPPGPPQHAAPMPSGGRYEFSPHENQTISKTGKRSTVWGVIALVSGALLLGGLVPLFMMRGELVAQGLDANWVTVLVVAIAPLAFVNLAIGGMYIGAGKALAKVVDTQGNDIDHMLQGLGKLGNAFMIEVITTIVSVVLGFVLGFWMAAVGVELERDIEDIAAPAAEAE